MATSFHPEKAARAWLNAGGGKLAGTQYEYDGLTYDSASLALMAEVPVEVAYDEDGNPIRPAPREEANLKSGNSLRELGYLEKMIKENRVLDAMREPVKFLRSRTHDIQLIDSMVSQEYERSIGRWLNMGYSDAEAREKSKQIASVLLEGLLKSHKAQFDEGYATIEKMGMIILNKDGSDDEYSESQYGYGESEAESEPGVISLQPLSSGLTTRAPAGTTREPIGFGVRPDPSGDVIFHQSTGLPAPPL